MGLTLLKREHPLASPAAQRKRLEQLPLSQTFDEAVAGSPLGELRSRRVEILQINVGKVCNQTCHHCHVDAGPERTEVMPDAVVDKILELLEAHPFDLLDITGGAPELHPRFRELVTRARALEVRVIDRTNLTILMTRPFADLPALFAAHAVEVVASLPHPSARSTDSQRGDGVFEKSIAALRRLNEVGYGMPGTGLELTLVTNPVGAFLPASQASLERDFKERLRRQHAVEFSRLLCITNMPISRYLDWLENSGNTEAYMRKLSAAFNPGAVDGVMCRNTLSVGWDGRLFDCDFNQMLELELARGQPRTVFELDMAQVTGRPIVTGAHCFGCTAGQGSSCGGATA
jgi:radical SAM/Cys-rich protein